MITHGGRVTDGLRFTGQQSPCDPSPLRVLLNMRHADPDIQMRGHHVIYSPRQDQVRIFHKRWMRRRRYSLGDGAQVHEVAVAAASASILLVLPAGCFPEISDG